MTHRAGAWIPAAIWAAVLFFVSSRPTVPVDLSLGLDKAAHLGAYLVLGLLLTHATTRHSLAPAVALALGMLYGISDEYHQTMVAGRSAELADWIADVIGVAVGVALYRYLWRRRAARSGRGAANAPETAS